MAGGGGGGKKSNNSIVGYEYYIGLHTVVGHSSAPSEADMEVTEILFGDRQAWSGNVTGNQQINIDKPDLFGGRDREGGIRGNVDILFGAATQTPNDYLVAKAGTPQPAYRGVLALVFRQIHFSSNNPYLKDLSIRYGRYFKGFYPAKARIGNHANPAHIIYECWTNQRWGMGYPTSRMNAAEFTGVADTLSAEGFGLSFDWNEQTSVESFIQDLINHIGAVSREDPTTGLVGLRLLRADYVVSSLPVLDPNNSELVEFQRLGWGETVNEVVVVYTDPVTGKDKSLTGQNLANLQIQTGVVSKTQRYRGIQSDALAARVLGRDLKVYSSALSRIQIRVNRSAWQFRIGDLFRLNEPFQGIADVVYRVGEIDRGTLTDRWIVIDALEDVFGLPSASYLQPQPTGWVDPVPAPAATAPRRLVEAPWWDLARGLSKANLAFVGPTDCFLQTLGGSPSPAATNYKLFAKTSSATNYTFHGNAPFAPHAIILAGMTPAVSTTVSYGSAVDIDLVTPGGYAYIDDEAVSITAINIPAQTVTVDRGVLDTVPVAHSAGATIWFADTFQGVNLDEYAVGETVNAKMLTVTGKGTLALAAAPTDTLTMQGRQDRPYPPGNLKINGVAWPAAVQGDLAFNWAHRDRLIQTVNLVAQSAGNIGPEPGVTYTLRIYRETGTLQRTYSGLTGTSQPYLLADDSADSGLGRPNAHLRIELESNRSGIISLYPHSIQFDRAGYGLQYGNYYGGI